MAYKDYSISGSILTLNRVTIDQFGETDGAIEVDDIDPRSTIKRGIFGGGARLRPATRPKRMTIYLMPGCDQVRWLIAQDKAGVTIHGIWQQQGTLEKEVFVDGEIVSRGTRKRAARTDAGLSDEVFVIEFLDSTET